MKYSRWATLLLFTLGLLVVTAVAWAFPTFCKSFLDLSGVKADSSINKAKCALCHTSVNKGDKLNPYGEDIAKVFAEKKTTKLSKEVLDQIGTLDSDGDGVANLDELKADTLPGDPNSTPVLKDWQLAKIAPQATVDGLIPALAGVPPRAMKAGTNKLGEVRLAVAEQELAVDVKVFDKRITPDAKEWNGTSVEIAGATVGGKTFRRLVIQPKTADGAGEVALFENATKQDAPALKWKATPLKDGGYELVALIPLAALQIDLKAPSFQLEAAVVASPAADTKAQFGSLFGSVEKYQDSSKFGTITLTKTE